MPSRLSDEKINLLSRLIVDELAGDGRVEFRKTSEEIRLCVRRTIGRAMQKEMEIATTVERKIASQKRGIVEGSAEWDALYWQYYEDEIQRLQSIR